MSLFYHYCLLALIFISPTAYAADQAEPPASGSDARTLVVMPLEAQRNLAMDMRQHLQALNAVIGLMALDDFAGAAEAAEQGLGFSSMGKFRGSPMAPGRHMPPEMKSIGRSMHAAASAFAESAAQGDVSNAKQQLAKVTSACVACHASYRVR